MAYVNLPSPGDFGWKLSEDYKYFVWITVLVASKACTELVKCSCKSSRRCRGRCACKAQWKCTELCSCNCDK